MCPPHPRYLADPAHYTYLGKPRKNPYTPPGPNRLPPATGGAPDGDKYIWLGTVEELRAELDIPPQRRYVRKCRMCGEPLGRYNVTGECAECKGSVLSSQSYHREWDGTVHHLRCEK